MNSPSTTDSATMLAAAGWTPAPNGQWLSPLTSRPFDERAALAIASIKHRNRNPIYRPRKFVRQ